MAEFAAILKGLNTVVFSTALSLSKQISPILRRKASAYLGPSTTIAMSSAQAPNALPTVALI